jgi:hypothetical protein
MKLIFNQPRGKWPDELIKVVWSHNTTASRSIGFTPFKLLFGDEAITPEEAKAGSIRTTASAEDEADYQVTKDTIEETRLQAIEHINKYQACWGPSSSEGPQKHDLTMFLEYNTRTGTFGLGSEPQCEEAQRIRRLTQRRSYAQGSFGKIAEKGTDLKGKRLFGPRWITIESLANVKGMSVILHGLCPVPINR